MFSIGDKVRITLDSSFLNPDFYRVYREAGYATVYYVHGNCVNVEVKNTNREIRFDGFSSKYICHFNININSPLKERVEMFMEREKRI